MCLSMVNLMMILQKIGIILLIKFYLKSCSLFFFDGEKIEQLADLEESKKVLKKAINSLLGLEIVDQLNVDVDEFKKINFKNKDDDDKKILMILKLRLKDMKMKLK